MSLKIVRGMQLPDDAVDGDAYEDLPAALALVNKVSRKRAFLHLNSVQQVAEEFPLLDSVEIEYCELSEEDIQASTLSDNDKRALLLNFCQFTCCVLLYTLPKLIVNKATDELLVGLRHEMVHLEQLIRGDTWLDDTEGQYWQGEWYPVENINGGMAQGEPEAVIHYLRLPWEREAYCRTIGEAAYQDMLHSAMCRVVVERILGLLRERADVGKTTLEVKALIQEAEAKAPVVEAGIPGEYSAVVDAIGTLEYRMNLGAAPVLWARIIEILEGDILMQEDWHPDNQVLINLIRACIIKVNTTPA